MGGRDALWKAYNLQLMKIRKGDQVKIISGNDKGKTARVTAVFPEQGRIAAADLNVKKKHVRPRRQGDKGELVAMPASFPASRAMLVCPSCGKAVRIGYRKDESGNVRICKKCSAIV